jgi:ribosomal protein S5
MPYFFNGRLYITPATMSLVDDSAMANQNLGIGNLLLVIGRSSGGEPLTPLRFGSPDQAKATLIDGELLTAVQNAFDPSADTGGPSTVIAIRVNPALQATLNLLDASNAQVINLSSTDYGLYTNQIKVKVEAASVSGKKLTTQFGTAFYSQDNVARNAFSVNYTGSQASAVMTVSPTTIVLSAPSGTAVATIDLNTFPSIQQVVDRINATTGFSSAVLDGNGDLPALNALDTIATPQDVKTTTYNATANLQAIVDWFNGQGEGFVTAVRATNAGTLPANLPYTYLAGGSDGITDNTAWSNAYSAAELVDVQWVVPISSDPSIFAMNDAHCAFMSTVGQKERRGIVGMANNTADTDAIAAAKSINSDRTSLVHIGYYGFNAAGALTLFPPYLLAAQIAGAFSGVNPGVAMTNKTLKVNSLERDLRNPTDTDVLIPAGVLCVEDTDEGYKVVQSVTTWLSNQNYNRVEVSVGVALDYTVRSLRRSLDALRGQQATPLNLARAVTLADSTCRLLAQPAPAGIGVLVGDATNPAYKNITANLAGDVIAVSLQVSPVLPINYIPITVFAVPYSGTATSA